MLCSTFSVLLVLGQRCVTMRLARVCSWLTLLWTVKNLNALIWTRSDVMCASIVFGSVALCYIVLLAAMVVSVWAAGILVVVTNLSIVHLCRIGFSYVCLLLWCEKGAGFDFPSRTLKCVLLGVMILFSSIVCLLFSRGDRLLNRRLVQVRVTGLVFGGVVPLVSTVRFLLSLS